MHEELAQGLGLANDSPAARPSIFNDDDEFALLTRHDEILLELLYDPALKPGMTPDEARPILRRLLDSAAAGRSDVPDHRSFPDAHLRFPLRPVHRRHPLDRR